MIDAFGGLLASFQLALEAEGRSPKTLDNYSRAVVQFADWLAANDRADDVATVTAADMRGCLVRLQGKVAPSTEYRNYSGARQFHNDGTDMDKCWLTILRGKPRPT